MAIQRIGLFVSGETNKVCRHIRIYHRPDENSRIVVIVSDKRDRGLFEQGIRQGIQVVFFDHALPRIQTCLVETCHFYDVDFLIVEPEYRHPISSQVCCAVGNWVMHAGMEHDPVCA